MNILYNNFPLLDPNKLHNYLTYPGACHRKLQGEVGEVSEGVQITSNLLLKQVLRGLTNL